ncbi:beta-glycosidase, partial [Bacteroides sp. OttesenSCG-928-D19]|nr:beta-glycosidase [Bacteroides sp. OttesenSCG-928-D19]
FQLLDLQDYPGQGSAYVGILDAFMDNKGVISAEEWREFCNDVVPLFVTEKFCWTTHETLTGDVKIANYSEHNLAGKTLKWELSNKENNSVSQGELPINATENGLLDVGSITPHIAGIATAQELTLTLQVVGTLYKNRYSLWIYPAETEVKPTPDVLVANRLTKEVTASLQEGANVLYFPAKEELKKVTIEPLFQTDYWNYRMFKGICEWLGKTVSPGTLGILTNPEHPVFGEFPTDYHTNWQWYPIIKQSYPLILDRLPAEYTPIVQVIDNVERNHKLGLIFEFSIGKGKLLVCMANLEAAMDKPEAKQLYKSMLTYMGSEAFNPQHRLSVEELKDLFSTEVGGGEIKGVRNISYE